MYQKNGIIKTTIIFFSE